MASIIGAYDHEADTRMTDPLMPKASKGMDGNAYDRWSASYNKRYSKALASLKKKITHVSQQKFETALNETVDQFMSCKPEQYVAFVEPGKSQKWVTEVALRNGLEPAAAYVAIGEEGANALAYALSDIEWDDDRFKEYVIIDDASYSGNQMANNISAANRIVRDKFPGAVPVFHVLVPFATETAINKIASLSQKGVDVRIYNADLMPTVAQAIEKTHHKAMQEILWPDMDPKTQAKRMSSTALHWFDHKIPNSMSFPEVLADGRTSNRSGPFGPRIPFLPHIQPPYKPVSDGKENALSEEKPFIETPVFGDDVRKRSSHEPSPLSDTRIRHDRVFAGGGSSTSSSRASSTAGKRSADKHQLQT